MGKTKIAGIDEVGRGPLCGPVVASAVIFPENIDIPGLTDSKKISPKKRLLLYNKIFEKADYIGVGIVNEDRIDEINKGNEIIVHCKSGVRSARICEFLIDNGYKNVKNLKGGVIAWAQEIDPSLNQY